MRLIDASKPETFPPELTEIVMAHISSIPDAELQRIRDFRIGNETDVRCALEKYLGTSSSSGYHMYRDELIPLFDRCEIVCYHATRVGSMKSILDQGLVSSWTDYAELLAAFLRQEGVAEQQIQAAMEAVGHEYHRKYGSQPHQICFYINCASLYSEDGTAAYDQFCETVGGELANWALMDRYPDILKVLQTKGVPAIVTFKTPFTKVADYHKDVLISPFVYSIAAKHIWEFDYKVEADSSLIGDVPPTDILDVSLVR